MDTYRNPQWWTKDYDTAWERVKASMRRDWDQTKHDFGGDEPDTSQDLDDTVAQAVGKQPIPPRGMPTYEEMEPAYRFGYIAHQHYGNEYTNWDSELEERLREDLRTANANGDSLWNRFKRAIRYGWEYEGTRSAGRKL